MSEVPLAGIHAQFPLHHRDLPEFTTNIWSFFFFYNRIKNQPPCKVCTSWCFALHQSRRGAASGVRYRDQSGCVPKEKKEKCICWQPIPRGCKWFPGPRFKIQRHSVLLMIIARQSVYRWYPQPLPGWCTPTGLLWSRGEGAGGRERLKSAQQVINAFLTQCCHDRGEKRLWRSLGSCSCRCPHGVTGSESIDHYGASELIESTVPFAGPRRNERREAKVSLHQWAGRRGRGGWMGGGGGWENEVV